MNLLSSTMKTPTSGESSSGAKVKRKSRSRGTVSPGTSSMMFSQEPEEPERPQVEYEVPREKTRVSRRVHRDVPSESDSAMGDLQPSSKRRSSIVSTSTRRTPTNSHHRHSNGSTAPVITAPTTRRQSSVYSQDASIAARRTLTSSASSLRPSNRKRLETQLLGDTNSSGSFGRQKSCGNNNEQEEEDEESHQAQQLSFGKGPDQEDWMTASSNNHAAKRVSLPSRASKYRNLSAGVNKKPRARVPVTKEMTDRPPSRQRHAFPTHLIDANAFDAPETTSHRGSSSSSSASSTSCALSSRRSCPSNCSSPPDSITGDRPPSRYMVKAKRHSQQGAAKDSSGLPSRRGVVDKSNVFSCNQAHHDPKTDGFADVDESVPPPFRIEVTTDASETRLDSPNNSRSTSSSSRQNTSQNSHHGRRCPTFSHQEQLLRMAVLGSDGSRGSDQTVSGDLDVGQSQLQWFGKDDQINNAHLFETIISLPSPRLTLEHDVDVAIEDDLEDSDGPQYRSRKYVSKQQPQVEPQQPVENHFPSRRAAAASKMASTKTMTEKPGLQWIRSSSNPFFVGSSSTVDYDSMDPETAIEQTPLYSNEDLMTLAATEMTDLHLDDYTALGDASMPIAPPPSTSGGWGGSRTLLASRSPPLRTSLGKDFLSLFAQH